MLVNIEGNCANVRTENGKSYINGVEVPNKPGVYNIGGAKVTVSDKFSNNTSIVSGNGNIQINMASGNGSINTNTRKRKSYSAHKDGKNSHPILQKLIKICKFL